MSVWRWLTASPRRAAWLLGACAFALALPGLGDLAGLGHPDEQFYLSIAVDSLDHHALAPTHDGVPALPKPPFVFWASQLSMLALGRNATAARLPGALAAGLAVAGGTLFAAEVIGAEAGALAGALLLGSLGVIRFGRELMLDLPLEACLAFGLWAFAAAARGRRAAALVAGFCSAFILGIKGPIGVAVLGTAALGPLLYERKARVLLRWQLWLGICVGAAASVPWYLWAARAHWHDFYVFHLQEQYLGRFEGTHGQSRFNLLWGTLLYAAPFWPLSLAGLMSRWRRSASGPTEEARLAWPVGWLLAFYVLFALPQEHGLHYPVLALVPLAAIAALPVPRGLRRLVGLAIAVAALGVSTLLVFPEVGRLPTLVVEGLGMVAGVLWLLGETGGSLALGALLFAAAVNLGLATLAPALGRPLLSPDAAALGRGADVGLLDEHPGPYRLTAGWGTGAITLWDDHSLRDALSSGKLIFAREHNLAKADPHLTERLEIVALFRRTRPYLSVGDVLTAAKTHDLNSLGETVGLYRARR